MTTSTHTEEITVMREGLRLHGRIDAPQGEPKGPVVILMHGFMADLGYEPGSLLQQVSDQLVEAGFTDHLRIPTSAIRWRMPSRYSILYVIVSSQRRSHCSDIHKAV